QLLTQIQYARHPSGPVPAPAQLPKERAPEPIEVWTGLLDHEFLIRGWKINLADQIFTDPQGYVQSLATKTQAREVFYGFENGVTDLTYALLKIREVDAELKSRHPQ